MRIGYARYNRIIARILIFGVSAVMAASLAPRSSTAADQEQVLWSFCSKATGVSACADGTEPTDGLIMDKTGNLYGTTGGGGAHSPAGTVFELTPNAARTKWTETTLYSFCSKGGDDCTDGAGSAAGLIMDGSGRLYGTTGIGGTHGIEGDTVFELTPNAARTEWTETVLYSFCAEANCIDGKAPVAGLIMDGSGHVYGTTEEGGTGFYGTVFELAPNPARTKWAETILHSFGAEAADGELPRAGLIMSSGHLYGTTYGGGVGCGTAFELTPDAARTEWTETVLYSFCTKPGSGSGPEAGLIMDKSGNLYGTTEEGGAHDEGTVFELKP
jgi:uncharacterized repeat protein (TIGR03803 family)